MNDQKKMLSVQQVLLDLDLFIKFIIIISNTYSYFI